MNRKLRAKYADIMPDIKKAQYDKCKNNPEWQERQRKNRERNRDLKRAYDKEYRGNKSHEERNKKSREWVKANPEKRKAISKAYKARRRQIESGGDSTEKIYEWEVASIKKCYWCGVPCKAKYHIDHYNPLSRGGKHEVSNLVISCPRCNLRKNAKDPYDFAAEVGRLF